MCVRSLSFPCSTTLILVLAALFCPLCPAETITLTWDPNTEPDLGGYLLWYGAGNAGYTDEVDTQKQTSATITLPEQKTQYFFAVSAYNTEGVAGALSNEVSYTTATPPKITTQPVKQNVNLGQTARFSVVASGTAPLAYQWSKNATPIAGATRSSYTTPRTVATDDGSLFAVVVSNAADSVTSKSPKLTVNLPPTIINQPVSKTVNTGRTADFSVKVTGTKDFTYQWRKNGVNIAGATTPFYTTPPTIAGDNGSIFSVFVTNIAGSVTSSGAILTLK